MSVVDLHPEQLFDALRGSTLSTGERARLEAHCAVCPACMFELRWVEAASAARLPTEADCAYGDMTLDRMLRLQSNAVPHTGVAKPSLGWKLPLAVGALIFAMGASLGWYFTGSGQAELARPVTAVSPSAPSKSEAETSLVFETHADVQHEPIKNIRAAARLSANQLLAAARRAQSRGDIDRAERLYGQVITEYSSTPECGAAQIAFGRLLFAREPFAALMLFDGYLRRRPSGTLAEEALFYRALSSEKLGESQLVLESLRELLKRFPRSLYAEPARARLAASDKVD